MNVNICCFLKRSLIVFKNLVRCLLQDKHTQKLRPRVTERKGMRKDKSHVDDCSPSLPLSVILLSLLFL